ncbi:epoxyqueuosine reductase QueH [Sulfurospirillum arcachonense]|uniref:epoxyqueuosine reductase QueH n=1 Tax=Sulfurospirillum arcachonense TaxID=57666 RepID=UPI00046A0521|nr:epoxyqueuosine reductase QueH [Sulfurospirillum arcachonense]
MLVHICCSVDSHFFLQKLQKLYPQKELIGFFYDPNIHPYSEYQLRLLDVQRSCKKLGIKLIEGEYDYEGWMQAVRGLESEPEKGKRCSVCFDNRLEQTAIKALEIGINEITTTLLTSPKKSIEQLSQNAKKIEQKYPLHVETPDFRKDGGTSEQFALAKKDMLYHQNYCGCLFALEVQRENQDRLKDELSSPITSQILPSSIQERIKLYKKVIDCEEKGEKFRLKREKFLNYRLLQAYVRKGKSEIVPSYILFYSTLTREFTRGKIEYIEDEIAYFNREEIIFLSIKKFNSILETSYINVAALMKKPPLVEEEIRVRKELLLSDMMSLNPIIILDTIEKQKFEILIKSKTYIDIRENLVKVR